MVGLALTPPACGVTAYGREIAEALAERLARIEPKPLDHPDAGIAAWANPKAAHGISSLIDQHLKEPGATELTTGDRVVELDGCTFLRPTVIWCEDAEHPLANTEFPFPFVSVVEVSPTELVESMGGDTGCHCDYRRCGTHARSYSNAPH